MRVLNPSGIWELFVPGVGEGTKYQYAIRGQNGHVNLKSDPLARSTEVAPSTASIVFDSHYSWGDQDWLDERASRPAQFEAMSIYEVHLGSWRQGTPTSTWPSTWSTTSATSASPTSSCSR